MQLMRRKKRMVVTDVSSIWTRHSSKATETEYISYSTWGSSSQMRKQRHREGSNFLKVTELVGFVPCSRMQTQAVWHTPVLVPQRPTLKKELLQGQVLCPLGNLSSLP
jgi:hypothetical protein